MTTFKARATATSDGANTLFSIPFPYLQPGHVTVQIRATAEATPIPVGFTFISTSVIQLTAPAPEGYLVDRIRSSSPDAPVIPFGGGTLTREELATNNLQLLYLVQEAEDLALAAGGTTVIITDPGGGGGGGPTITTPRYGFANGSGPPYAGLIVDSAGQLGQSFDRELWLDMFYTDDTTTDSQALAYFASLFNNGTIGDVTLHFAPSRGRGPAGRYIIDQEILFTGGSRLVLDFHEATVRWTTPMARIHYKAPQVLGSSGVTPIAFFIVRNVVCQYAAAIDCLFYWDFQYIDSRDMGTGYVENLRAYPQDNNNAGHTTVSTFRTKNTWYWSASLIHAKGPPRTPGNYVAGSSFLRQEGVCVVAVITDACELEFFDTAIIPGIAPMVGVNGTFSGGASYGRGKALRQGSNIAYFGRSDSYAGAGTYSLYDEVGALVNGLCEVLDSVGSVTGSFTITSVTRFGQASEAISVSGGTTIINGNYVINATSPNPATKFLEWNFEDIHTNLAMGAIKVDGVAVFSFGSGMMSIVAGAGSTLLDITNGDNINVLGLQCISGAGSGDLPNVTVLKGRNITGGQFSNNSIYFCKYAANLDNTVKSFKVHGNTAYELTTSNNPTICTFLNTGNRYNTANTRGIDFKSNGRMGRGFDTDDNHMLAWAPVPTAQNGATLTYAAASGGGINVSNGVLTLSAKLTITGIGTAASPTTNEMYLSFPASTVLTEFGMPASALSDFLAHCRIGTLPASALYDSVNQRFVISDADPFRNAASTAFKAGNAAVSPPYSVFIQASIPVQYD